MQCEGVIKQPSFNGPAYRLVFQHPPALSDPQYLRTALETPCESSTLDGRFSIVRQLARAVMFIHSTSFVHKNIRPETILTFKGRDRHDLQAFLTGFESFRLEAAKTSYQGDDDWQKNIYRHPDRQGSKPDEEYVMQHDIYSLGVCLLELGLSSSFVRYKEDSEDVDPDPRIKSAADATNKDTRKKGYQTKRIFVALAQQELPAKMGRRYTETVATCLTCLDKAGNKFGDKKEFEDENGILVGVRYIEKVLAVLLDIRI